MKTGAMVLGIIGGVVFIGLSLMILIWTAFLEASFFAYFGVGGGPQQMTAILAGALIFGVLGLLGGLFARSKMLLAAIMMLIAAVAGLIYSFEFFSPWAAPSILLMVGGVLAIVGHRQSAI